MKEGPIHFSSLFKSLERFTEVGIVEVSDSAPETVIRISAFRKEAVDVWVPFKRTAEGMEDAEKARDKICRETLTNSSISS